MYDAINIVRRMNLKHLMKMCLKYEIISVSLTTSYKSMLLMSRNYVMKYMFQKLLKFKHTERNWWLTNSSINLISNFKNDLSNPYPIIVAFQKSRRQQNSNRLYSNPTINKCLQSLYMESIFDKCLREILKGAFIFTNNILF